MCYKQTTLTRSAFPEYVWQCQQSYTLLTYFPQYHLHRLQEKTVVCVWECAFVCVTLLQFAVVLCKRSSGVLETVLYLVVSTTQLTDTVIRREGVYLDKWVLKGRSVVVWTSDHNICACLCENEHESLNHKCDWLQFISATGGVCVFWEIQNVLCVCVLVCVRNSDGHWSLEWQG